MPITQLTTLIDRVIEFYDSHQWAKRVLYDGQGFCVLGAAAAVLSNEKRLIREYKKTGQNLGRPSPDFHGTDLLIHFQNDYRKATGISVGVMNDHAKDKREVIQRLKEYRKLIAWSGSFQTHPMGQPLPNPPNPPRD